MKKRTARQLGKLGEDALQTWAHQENLTVNKALEDERGWDFLLEFPPSDELPYDKRPQPLTCWMQVKATDSKGKKQDIKLSNWERLVKTSYPAFFLICEFDQKRECQRAYLVHIGKDLIHRVLKKLRELSSMGRPLHKSKLRLRYDETHSLPSIDGPGLVEAITSRIGDTLETYIKKKTDLVQSVGYEKYKKVVHITASIPATVGDPIDYWVDFLLGRVSAIENASLEIEDHRFGIKDLQSQIFKNGKIEIKGRKPFGKGRAIFRIPSKFKAVSLNVTFFIPEGLSFDLARSHGKVLFKAPFLEFTIRPRDKGLFSLVTPKLDESYSLSDLRKYADLVLLFHQAQKDTEKITCKILLSSLRLPNSQIDISKPINGQIISHESVNDSWVEIAKVIRSAWIIAKYFDVHDEVNTKIVQLSSYSQRLNILASIIDPIQTPSFKVSNIPIENLDPSQNICVPLLVSLPLGDNFLHTAIVILQQFSLLKEMEGLSDAWEFETKIVSIFNSSLLPSTEDQIMFMRELLKILINEYEKNNNVIVLEGMMPLWDQKGN